MSRNHLGDRVVQPFDPVHHGASLGQPLQTPSAVSIHHFTHAHTEFSYFIKTQEIKIETIMEKKHKIETASKKQGLVLYIH